MLAGTDAEFAGATWTGKAKVTADARSASHPYCPRRRHRLAARRPDHAHPPRLRPHPRPLGHKEIAYGITSLPPALAGPCHLGLYARHHWAIENREHYVRDKTFSEDLQQVRTGNQPSAYAAIRNLVIGAFRRAGFANIAHARRYYGRDDQRILALYGYT